MNMLKDLLKGRYNRIVTYLTICCIAYLILFEIILKYTPEIFSWGNELVSIVSAIALSIVSSYIFYLIVVFMPERSKKKSIEVYLNQKLEEIITIGDNMMGYLIQGAGSEKEITESVIIEICNKTKITDNINLACGVTKDNNGKCKVRYYTWIDYLQKYPKNNLEILKDVLKYVTLLDETLIEIINEFLLCNYLSNSNLSLYISLINKEQNLKVLAVDFYKYYQIIGKLKNYKNTM